jgi:hypothetical protein
MADRENSGGSDEGGDRARSSPERSRYGEGQSGFGGEHYRPNGSGADHEGGSSSSSASDVGREQSNTSHFDENYRRWREAGEAQGSDGGGESLSEPGMHEAGEETAGGGDASAMESSTGSSPDTDADGRGRT